VRCLISQIVKDAGNAGRYRPGDEWKEGAGPFLRSVALKENGEGKGEPACSFLSWKNLNGKEEVGFVLR
jgi:hypothetical protein